MNPRILILDDDASICKIYAIILTRLGIKADTVATGEEAISLYTTAQSSGKSYMGVILDLMVKDGMGGLETLQKLKKINPAVYAVVASGSSRETIESHYPQQGFSDTLAKPFHAKDVTECIARMQAATAA